MEEKKLPERWEEKSLSEVAHIEMGQSPPGSSYNTNSEGLPFFQGKTEFGKIYPKVRKHTTEPKKIVPKGTILLSVRAPVGPTNIAPYECCIGRGLAGINGIAAYTQYVFNFFRHIEGSLSQQGTGTTFTSINKKTIENLVIPLPPLEEQKRIVAKLNQLMGHVDRVKEQMARIPELLKQFRQSVLTQAVTGQLTKEWRVGKELGEWEEKILLEVIIEKPRNGYSPRAVSYQTEIKSLSLSATTSGKFDPAKVKYLDIKPPTKDSHLWLKKDDILIQRSNSFEYVGTTAIYDGEDNDFIYPDIMMKVSVNEKILTKYLKYSLSSQATKQYFQNKASGTAGNMPKINQGVVSNTPINLPPLPEQEEIVRRVESLFAMADRIEQQYSELEQRVAVLPQAILAKAFRGELV